ncbi:putative ubiquitin-specific protease [Maudiozyma humilis]|uniref:ubiquitinyl hydrolase 1 n=1 Tax=Maudiozyma humilis TaxID=51915 RepID=A0AAV5RWM7_MAUHU|nr:putative ubiquitin-specific protease [Kazachstania humilis]
MQDEDEYVNVPVTDVSEVPDDVTGMKDASDTESAEVASGDPEDAVSATKDTVKDNESKESEFNEDDLTKLAEQLLGEDRDDEKTDDEPEVSQIATSPVLTDQRAQILQLLHENKDAANEGDRIYIIPKGWYDAFFDQSVTDPQELGPIDINSITVSYKNFVLKDYDKFPYVDIPETVFIKLVEWYGMEGTSKPLWTYLIRNPDNGQLVTEFNKRHYRLQYLLAPETKSQCYSNSSFRDINNQNVIVASVLETVKDVVTKVVEMFYEVEDDLDISDTRIRMWFVSNTQPADGSEASPLPSSYLIDELMFLSYDDRKRIRPKIFDERITDLRMYSGNFVLEIKQSQRNFHWTSNYLKYNPLPSPPGTVGLQNLGNTCYMNSALQCLVHIPQLRDYFLYNGFTQEINETNPLGYQGYMANAFSSLIHSLFTERLDPSDMATSLAPSQFKSTIGHFNSMFSGYQQQDSQEFLAFLLDSLHEDLNRIIDKPYIEKPSLTDKDDVDDFDTIKKLGIDTWEKHLQRNDSVITDLFVGLYKSTLECPECNNVSVTFDPYNDLTLPLPVDSIWKSKVRLFPQNSPPCTLEVELGKNATYQDLKKYIAEKAEMNVNDIYGCEIFSHQFYSNFEANNSNSNFLALRELISEGDVVIFYEIKANKGDIIIPVLNSCLEDGYSSARLFGIPFFIAMSPEEFKNPFLLRQKLEQNYMYLSGGPINFPDLNDGTEENISIDDFSFLKTKYPDIDLQKYIDHIKFVTPDLTSQTSEEPVENESVQKFFDIKVMNDIDARMVSASKPNEDDNQVFWTPPPHSHFNTARALTDFVDPVVADLYNYVYPNSVVKPATVDVDMNEDSDSDKESDMFADADMDIEIDGNQDEALVEDKVPETNETKDTTSAISESAPLTPISPQLSYNGLVAVVCQWNTQSFEEAFSADKIINWERPGVLENKELEQIQKIRLNKSQKEVAITLDDCLKLFSRKEVLGVNDLWYCPKCKEHRQASKRIQLWNTPDILSIQLKRFESSRSFSDKITDVVRFPIVSLDMSPHVVDQTDVRGYTYDLIAVDNHYGGIGGGHYTAYVKNPQDNKWYYFNDARVTRAVPEDSISGAAYLLFYQRRANKDSDPSASHTKLQRILDESRKEHADRLALLQEKQDQLYEENATEDEMDAEASNDKEDEEKHDDADDQSDVLPDADEDVNVDEPESPEADTSETAESKTESQGEYTPDERVGSAHKRMRLVSATSE